MAALSANRSTKALSSDPKLKYLSVPIADNVHVFTGALVGVDASGNLIPASASAVRILGRAEEEYDNTIAGHAAGAKDIRVAQGCFKFDLAAAPSAPDATSEGQPLYAVDDHTVARDSAAGTRPFVGFGVLSQPEGDIYVQVGLEQFHDPGVLHLQAADNFAATPHVAVKVINTSGTPQAKTAGAGDEAIGIIENAPGANAMARIRVFGTAQGIASGVITVGADVAADANGQVKAASALAVSGAAANGSYVLGKALSTGSQGNAIQILVRPSGAPPTNGV